MPTEKYAIRESIAVAILDFLKTLATVREAVETKKAMRSIPAVEKT